MTPTQLAALDRAISEHLNNFMTTYEDGYGQTAGPKSERHHAAIPWSSDWRYAGELLERLIAGRNTLPIFHWITGQGDYEIGPAANANPNRIRALTIPEAIALKFASENRIEWNQGA